MADVPLSDDDDDDDDSDEEDDDQGNKVITVLQIFEISSEIIDKF